MGRGFTLVDVLVSIGVIAVLIGILLPSLSGATATARRVACSSNVRQLGLGLYMYADDYKGFLVPSAFVPGWRDSASSYRPQEMMQIRFASTAIVLGFGNSWDGLGFLFAGDYLPAPKIFYCHAHRGNHPFSKYAASFGTAPDDVVANYHYRGIGPDNTRLLHFIIPANSALLADGMRTRLDYNHKVGLNVLRADQGVVWYDDSDGSLSEQLPDDQTNGSDASTLIFNAWKALDDPGHGSPR